MKLNFPNQSRSFDPANKCIRFWGYDGPLEIKFFMEEDALKKLSPKIKGTEAEFLNAFDVARKRIHKVANKAYGLGPRGLYVYFLAAKDF